MFNKLKFGSYDLKFREAIFAILTHHKSFNNRLFLSDIEIEKPWHINQKDFNDFLQRGELLNSIKKHLPSSQIDILDIKKYILN